MTSRWRRMPGRRSLAAAAVAVVLASGLTYAGLNGPTEQRDSAKATARAPLSEADASVQAARTGAPVEATAMRTAYSSTWARADGMMQRRIHASPIRAKVDGTWKAIDATLTRADGGWAPKATNVRMVFSAGAKSSAASGSGRASRSEVRRVSLLKSEGPAGNALVTLTTGGHDIVLTWPGPIPTPVIDGSRALYPEILPGADLVLTADDGGFAQLLVVKNRQAAADPRVAQLSYGLSSPDLSFSLDPVTASSAPWTPAAWTWRSPPRL
ncbi:hypothetical protein [Streptomyces sp. A3M-1-3]|uniref:hypothetical protein n=1 Tax=Streptomyces sp. A3M-1-3 TaxID=2962044 RepID=UPI0027E514A7|nr:hypothetical protein [Streptomyces sp. A3M-1-3]